MAHAASRALVLARGAALAVLRTHGHASARAAEDADDRLAIASAAAAAQSFGPPGEEAEGGSESGKGESESDEGDLSGEDSDGAENVAACVPKLVEQVAAMGVASRTTRKSKGS